MHLRYVAFYLRARDLIIPGLVTLAAATRAGADRVNVFDHAQELPGGLAAVPCSDRPDQARSALTAAAEDLGELFANADRMDVIVDVGRLRSDSLAMPLVREADVVLMVSARTAEQLQPSARRMTALRPEAAHLGWVLVGDGPHTPAEVESAYGFPIVAAIPHDPRAARALEGAAPTRRLRRTPLVRAAATLASNLSGWLHPTGTPSVAPTVDEEISTVGAEAPTLTELARQTLDVFADPDESSVEPAS